VGPCAAGKSTLANNLIPRGYTVRQIAQEHSFVPDMWKRISNPDVLIFLDVSYEQSLNRKKINWSYKEYLVQQHRLRNARENANLLIETDRLSQQQVFEKTLAFLRSIPSLNNS
jgi:guanylate kinase